MLGPPPLLFLLAAAVYILHARALPPSPRPVPRLHPPLGALLSSHLFRRRTLLALGHSATRWLNLSLEVLCLALSAALARHGLGISTCWLPTLMNLLVQFFSYYFNCQARLTYLLTASASSLCVASGLLLLQDSADQQNGFFTQLGIALVADQLLVRPGLFGAIALLLRVKEPAENEQLATYLLERRAEAQTTEVQIQSNQTLQLVRPPAQLYQQSNDLPLQQDQPAQDEQLKPDEIQPCELPTLAVPDTQQIQLFAYPLQVRRRKLPKIRKVQKQQPAEVAAKVLESKRESLLTQQLGSPIPQPLPLPQPPQKVPQVPRRRRRAREKQNRGSMDLFLPTVGCREPQLKTVQSCVFRRETTGRESLQLCERQLQFQLIE